MPDQTVPPPRGDSQRAEKYISQLLPLISSGKVSIQHTDLSKFDPSSLQDHYLINVSDFHIEISHSKSPTTGYDSYVMLFTRTSNAGSQNQKEILAYLTLSDEQFKKFRAVAEEQIETKKRLEEESRFKTAMSPIESLLDKVAKGEVDPNKPTETEPEPTQSDSTPTAAPPQTPEQTTQPPVQPPIPNTPPAEVAVQAPPAPNAPATPPTPETMFPNVSEAPPVNDPQPAPISAQPTVPSPTPEQLSAILSQTPAADATPASPAPSQTQSIPSINPQQVEDQTIVINQPPFVTQTSPLEEQFKSNAIPDPNQTPLPTSQVPVEQTMVHEEFAPSPQDTPQAASAAPIPTPGAIDQKLESAFQPAQNAELTHDTQTPEIVVDNSI